jgi:hypothetical protein
VRTAFLSLLFVCLAAASSARADQIFQVTGNFSCGGSGFACGFSAPYNTFSENFSVSYQLDQETGMLVPGSMSFTSTGNLGTFVAQAITNPMFANWTDQFGNTIQLDFEDGPSDPPFPVSLSCDRCGAAFFWLDGGNPQFNDSVLVAPVAAAEPSALLLLTLGALGIALPFLRKR